MSGTISANTQAILLLTAPLLTPGGEASADLLPPALYKKLVRQLRDLNAQPADLLTPQAKDIIAVCGDLIPADRLKRLLGRGFLLSQVVERWQARAIWVISRADPAYPKRLKRWLREDAPAVLYGCGATERLDEGGLAVVGSRHVDDDLIGYAEAVGALSARSHRAVVSGGARGIDQAAMRGAAQAGGQVVGVLADSLEKSVILRDHRRPLMDGRMVLVSPYDPGARFNVGHAMQRNKLIYALADAALVVSAEAGKGGTWAGATEQLRAYRFTPVYVRQSGSASEGLDALRRQGARAWPEPMDRDAFDSLLNQDAVEEGPAEVPPVQGSSPEAVSPRETSPAVTLRDVVPLPTDADLPAPADRLWNAIRPVLSDLLAEPQDEAAVADLLQVSKTQARAWLTRLTQEGIASKDKLKRYALVTGELFGSLANAKPPTPRSRDAIRT